MLRPSAFQNNGNSGSNNTESTSSKSILRPSSFQLAASNLQTATTTATTATTVTTVTTATPANIDDSEPTTTSSSTPDLPAHESLTEDDGKISSTTNNSSNDNENTVVECEDVQTTNPFNNNKVKNVDDDSDRDVVKVNNDTKPATQSNDKVVSSALGSTGMGNKNLFVPNPTNLFAAATSKNSSIRNGSENNIGFVFGQNIHERIIGAPDTSTASNHTDDTKSDSCSSSELFAAAAANSASSSTSSATATSSTTSTSNGSVQPKETSRVEDLTKAAREYEESRVQKRKYDEVETFTGEENEVNVLDVNSKIFAFISSNWEQRGPGSLRLNDPKDSSKSNSSRVVFRTSGNLRVVLNTKVWAGMVVEKSSQKSLRLTAIDSNDGQIKIFLAMARPDDISILYTELKKRIDLEKGKGNTNSTTSQIDGIPIVDVETGDANEPESGGDIDSPCTKKEKKL